MPADADLLELATDIAREAGALILQRRREGVEIAQSKSSPEDVVTHADRESEELISRLILAARPDDGILGEEGASKPSASGLTWVVDPIDGTVNYLYGLPRYAVSVAVVQGDPDPATWTALAGAVFNPAADELFQAARGGGALMNGRGIRVTNPTLDLALVGTGFSYSAEIRMQQAQVVGRLIGRVRDIRRLGAASLDLCDVGSGRLDAYFERELKPWDHAAAALIAAEAGALVTGRPGRRAGQEFVLAAHLGLHAQLEALVG